MPNEISRQKNCFAAPEESASIKRAIKGKLLITWSIELQVAHRINGQCNKLRLSFGEITNQGDAPPTRCSRSFKKKHREGEKTERAMADHALATPFVGEKNDRVPD